NRWRGGESSAVIGFLGSDSNGNPWGAVSAKAVDAVMANCGADGVARAPTVPPRRRFRPGRKVRLIAGPMSGLSATVRQDDGRWDWLRLQSGWPARVTPESCAAM